MWLSIYFPQLSLESLSTTKFEVINDANGTLSRPVGITENNQIICINQSAYQSGVRVAQSLTSAYAICGEIQLYERHLQQELQTLHNIALSVYNFSPSLVIDERGFVLIEIARSLKLFGGLRTLLTQLENTLNEEVLSYQLSVGHNLTSAQLLSFKPLTYSLTTWSSEKSVFDIQHLEKQIEQLPIELMLLPEKTLAKIHSIGIKTIAQLRQLPNRSLRKRFGNQTNDYLLKLFNNLAEPKNYFIPAQTFSQKLEFIDVVHHRQGLLFPIKRLVQSLCRFLTVKQKTCQYLHWELFDSEKNVIGFDVLISDSQVRKNIFIELTQLNLERYTLHAPIESISLTAEKLSELNVQNQQLFDQLSEFKSNHNFIHKIRAKLGNDSCYSFIEENEHLPELAYRRVSDIKSTEYRLESYQDLQAGDHLLLKDNNNHQNILERPSWLLEKPKPIHFNRHKLLWKGELKIISAQERITNYWWKKKVARDYFLAEHENGTVYWVFYDQLKKQWFIHGVYG